MYTELYHYAAAAPRAAALIRSPQEASLTSLLGRLSDEAAYAVDALTWGWWSYCSFHEDRPLDPTMVRRAYQALLTIPNTVTEEENHVTNTMRAVRLTKPATADKLTPQKYHSPMLERLSGGKTSRPSHYSTCVGSPTRSLRAVSLTRQPRGWRFLVCRTW